MTNDFDFFVGNWTSTQRRLKQILAGGDEWEEFTGVTRTWSIFGGAGNIDEVTFPDRDYDGLTVRLYDPRTGLWSLYWANSTLGLGVLPTVGRFEADGTGRFYNDEDYQGRPIRVRYLWTGITADTCHWEQAFSPDAGETWETNWTADFTRTPSRP